MSESACCKDVLFQEPLYLVVPGGRKTFGHIAMCGKCRKFRGMAKTYRGAPGGYNATSWRLMMAMRSEPPFYFVQRQDGSVVPEGYSGGAVLPPVKLSGQDLAAGAAVEDDFGEVF